MKVRILDKSTVKHDGAYLEAFEVYDLPDEVANQLINSGEAQVATEKPASELPKKAPKTPKFDAKKNGGYVAEAVIDPVKKEKLAQEGKLSDNTPVVGSDSTQPKDTTPEPDIKTEVHGEDGHVLTEEEIKAREAAATSGSIPDTTPTV